MARLALEVSLHDLVLFFLCDRELQLPSANWTHQDVHEVAFHIVVHLRYGCEKTVFNLRDGCHPAAMGAIYMRASACSNNSFKASDSRKTMIPRITMAL